MKCAKQQEFVIARYTPSSKGLPGLGSLVLGVYEKGKLIYAGRVGTGFTFKQRSDLKKQLDKVSRQTSPLAGVPKDRDCVKPIGPNLRWSRKSHLLNGLLMGRSGTHHFKACARIRVPKEVVRELTDSSGNRSKSSSRSKAKNR